MTDSTAVTAQLWHAVRCGVHGRGKLVDTASPREASGEPVSVSSALFRTLTLLGGCAVMLLGQSARGADPPAAAPAGAAAELPDFQLGLW